MQQVSFIVSSYTYLPWTPPPPPPPPLSSQQAHDSMYEQHLKTRKIIINAVWPCCLATKSCPTDTLLIDRHHSPPQVCINCYREKEDVNSYHHWNPDLYLYAEVWSNCPQNTELLSTLNWLGFTRYYSEMYWDRRKGGDNTHDTSLSLPQTVLSCFLTPWHDTSVSYSTRAVAWWWEAV